MPGDAEDFLSPEGRYYWRMAEECLASAGACYDEAAKQSLLYLARSYLAMADTAERPGSMSMMAGGRDSGPGGEPEPSR